MGKYDRYHFDPSLEEAGQNEMIRMFVPVEYNLPNSGESWVEELRDLRNREAEKEALEYAETLGIADRVKIIVCPAGYL